MLYLKGTEKVQENFEIDGTATVEEFKYKAGKELGARIIVAVFEERILIDKNKTLSDYGVKEGSVIQIIEKLGRSLENED